MELTSDQIAVIHTLAEDKLMSDEPIRRRMVWQMNWAGEHGVGTVEQATRDEALTRFDDVLATLIEIG